jgi:hypothetical protein
MFVNGMACWKYSSLDPGQIVRLFIIARIDRDAPSGEESNVVTFTSDNAGSGSAFAVVTVKAVSGPPVPVTG